MQGNVRRFIKCLLKALCKLRNCYYTIVKILHRFFALNAVEKIVEWLILKMKTRMYTCTMNKCFRSFRDEESLRKHEICHGNEIEQDPKNFTCLKCNRVLATKQSLKEHTYTHSGKKPFRCSEIGCGKTFRQSSQLCNHRKVHKEAKKMMKIQTLKDKRMSFLVDKRNETMCSQSIFLFSDASQKIILPPIFSHDQETLLPSIDSF